VLKKLTGTALDVAKVAAHELHSHPLSIKHPNIIETHFVSNGAETFLVEEWLPEVLNDNWAPGGMQQTANLFYGISKAIETVHQLGYVHGDIKPDNIGKKDDRFILLDFGICRPMAEFTAETTATGSLRTRAPELLLNEVYSSLPTAADIWALGATIFNFQEERFPFVRRDEKVPRVSDPTERESFERQLSNRVRDEWDKWVCFEKTPNPLRLILAACLDRRPENRPSAAALRESIEKELPAYIPEAAVDQESSFAPIAELKQLSRLALRPDDIRLLAADDRGKLLNRVLVLKERLANSEVTEDIRKLESLLSA
jgi:serine/threonine protein kinase